MPVRAALIVAALAVLVARPPLAHADPQSAYIAELQSQGVDYSTPAAAITMGKAACNALSSGNSVASIIKTIEDTGFTGHDTGIILGAAANTFCTDQLPTIQGFISNHGG